MLGTYGDLTGIDKVDDYQGKRLENNIGTKLQKVCMLGGLKCFQHFSHFIAVTARKIFLGRFIKSSSLLWLHDAPLQYES